VAVVLVALGVEVAADAVELDVLVESGVVAACAVGSAVPPEPPLHAASATTGATRPTTARRRSWAREAVDGRAGAGAEVFISPPA
jgi:hypothetical protein